MPSAKFRGGAAAILAALLVACGGGTSGADPAPATAPLAVNLPTGGAADPRVVGYELIGSARVTRTVFEYTYRLTLDVGSNAFPAGAALRARSDTAATLVTDGSVLTGPLSAASRVTPPDTFTFRQDRTVPFDPAAIRWEIGSSEPVTSGLRTINSNGVARQFYLELPADYAPGESPRPLVFAYHGTGGSYLSWPGSYRLKEDGVGDGAILVYPNALPNGAGTRQWDFATDFRMFEDMLATLPGLVTFDPDRVFATGHSSGGGFAHELGCRYGSRIRAIAPVAGSLTATSCTGSVAVIQVQGNRDSLVPVAIAGLGRRFWVLYNGFDRSQTIPGIEAPCVSYAVQPSTFPVEWCLHDEGADGIAAHAWPSFASRAIWNFFQSLPAAAVPHPDTPPGGGNARVLEGTDTTLSVTLRFPAGMPLPLRLAATLGPPGARQPLSGAPLVFLNVNVPTAGAIGGDVRSYGIPVTFTGEPDFPGSYTLQMTVYCEGGGFPIPVSGIDHVALADIELVGRNTPIVVPGVLDLEPVRNAL